MNMNELFLLDDGSKIDLYKLEKKLVLFFYPKDDTPGCTLENQDFSLLYKQFNELGFEVIGVSKDSLASHCKFKNKYTLSCKLISDVDGKLCNKFSVINPRSLYGKIFLGIERSTFILDDNFQILQEWRRVKSTNHAQMVLEFIKNNNL